MEFLKEPNGKISFTRVSATVLIIFYIIISSYLSFKNHTFVDIPSNLLMLIVGLYGINKSPAIFSEIISAKTNKIKPQ